MGVIYFSIILTFEPSRYCKCWIVCFYYIIFLLGEEWRKDSDGGIISYSNLALHTLCRAVA